MLVAGEKINSIIPSVQRIIKERDGGTLQKLALDQVKLGAKVLDINTDDTEMANPEMSRENIRWAIRVIQEATNIPLMIDSADFRVLAAGLEVYDFSKGTPFLNSLNERNKEEVVELLLNYKCKVVVLVDMRATKTVEEKIEATKELKAYLQEKNIDPERIYVDPAVSSIGFDSQGALRIIETIKRVKKELGLKSICAPSNVSYGVPGRKLLNTAFIKMLKRAGIGAIIADPKDASAKISREDLKAAKEVLKGEDKRLKNYLKYLRDRGEIK